MITFILMAVGGLNWLLVGVADLDLVASLFGAGSTLAKVVYIVVGLATVAEILTHKKSCTMCK
jgi:uncharacterized membrane protein YuzA (DUF378 family)